MSTETHSHIASFMTSSKVKVLKEHSVIMAKRLNGMLVDSNHLAPNPDSYITG